MDADYPNTGVNLACRFTPSDASTRDLSLYECHLAIDTEAPRRDNIGRFLQCMNGASLVWSEGRYKLIAEYPTTQAEMDALVTAHYTDDNVILGSTIDVSYPSAEDRLQRATVRFKNESTDLVEDSVAWPKRNSPVHSQYLTEDGGIVSETEVEFEGCINRKLALAKAEYLVRQSRKNKTVSFEINTDGWVHEQGDFIKVSSDAAGITDEIYQIEKIRVTAKNTVQISARRFDWQDQSWNVDDNFVEPTATFFSSEIPNPLNLAWNSGSRNGESANGWLSWDAPSRARRFHIAQRLVANTEWTHLGETNRNYFDIPADLNDGQDRYFIVRTETAGGRLSDGAIVLADLMPNLVPVSSIQKTKTAAGVRLTWSNANPELVAEYKVWVNTVDNRGSASLHDTVTNTSVELTDLPVQAHYVWIDTHGYSGAVAAQSGSTVISSLDLHVQGTKLDANTIAWSALALGVRDQIDSAGDANQSAANALASELAANTFAAAASASASDANNYAGAASSAALNANTSAANALSSEQAAAVSETNAQGSSASAATSATNAATSEDNAGNSASAASASASAAATSANSAGQSATSATSSKNSAATSASQALTYKNEAATSASTANDAAAAAVETEGVVARILGAGSFDNPTLSDWTGTYPAGFGNVVLGEGSLSKVAGKYGNALRFTNTVGSESAPLIQIRSTYTKASFGGADDCVGLAISAEVEKVSGWWNGGSCIRVVWQAGGTGGSSSSQYIMLDDHRGTKGNGELVQIEAVVARPDDYVAGSSPGEVHIRIYGASGLNGATVKNSTWELHRISVKEVSVQSEAYIQQKAVADLQGNQEASIALRTKAGSGGAELELVSLADAQDGSTSQARISAEDIILNGSVFVDQLTIDRHLDLDVDNSGFRMGKLSISDYARDGIYFGKTTGTDGFGFFAGRTAGGQDEYIRITKDEFNIQNATFLVGSSSQSASLISSSQTVTLPVDSTLLNFTAVGGGGGGSGETAGGDGGTTTIRLRNSSDTIIQTWTAPGGAGGGGGTQWSVLSPYGNGGSGSEPDYPNPGGPNGDAATALTISNYDISGVTGPKLEIIIGAAGTPGVGSTLPVATAGAVDYVVEGDTISEAGPVSYNPTINGTWSYGGGNSWTNLPAKGGAKGAFYVLANCPANADIDLKQGQIIETTHAGYTCFFTELRPRFRHSSSLNIDYWIYPLG